MTFVKETETIVILSLIFGTFAIMLFVYCCCCNGHRELTECCDTQISPV